jgi:hypothetical protein
MNYASPDLTQHPPRSPRVRLGGYVILPRCLDKCRAVLAGKVGEYKYACPLDQHMLKFAGIDADALMAAVKKGLGDAEILAWITTNAATPREEWEIAHWSTHQESRAPADNEGREALSKYAAAAKVAEREDIRTWFDLLDADDFASFGGKA